MKRDGAKLAAGPAREGADEQGAARGRQPAVKVQPANDPSNEARRTLHAALDAFLDLALAPVRHVESTPRYATKKCNPCGSSRGFVTACSSGAFDTFKLGRELAAKWEDVAAYVERRVLPVRQADAKPPLEEDEDRRALAAAGVQLRPAANDARRAGRGRR